MNSSILMPDRVWMQYLMTNNDESNQMTCRISEMIDRWKDEKTYQTRSEWTGTTSTLAETKLDKIAHSKTWEIWNHFLMAKNKLIDLEGYIKIIQSREQYNNTPL